MFTPQPPTPKKRHLLRWIFVSLAGLLVLFFGIGTVGALAGGGYKSASAVGPAPTVTVTSTATVTRTVTTPGPTQTVTVPGPIQTVPGPVQTVTKTETVTPDSCAQALAAAETVMGDDNKGWSVALSAINDIQNGNYGSADSDSTQLQTIASQKQADNASYTALADQCKAGH